MTFQFYLQRTSRPLPAAIRACAFVGLLLSASGLQAGEPTKREPIQPGGEGAKVVYVAEFDSLQVAVDVLPPGGGVVELPPGRLELSEPVVIARDDILLRGAGTATHLVNRNENGKPALLIQPPEGAKKAWRVQIADLRVTGNPKSGPGIVAKDINELLISRVAVEHNGGDGIVLDHCYEDPRVSDSLITYNKGTGLNLLGCHDIVVSANQFEENIDAVRCIDGFNLTMTGNNVDDHLGNGVVIENTYGSVVSGNMIEECNGHAVVLKGTCYGDALSANTFAHCQGDGVRLEGVRDITISANTFVLLAGPAVHALDGARQLTVSANTFNRYPFDPTVRHKEDPGQGIVLEGARDVTMAGNSFTGMFREAIKATGEGNKRLNITGNTILNPSQTEPGAHAALHLENLSGSIISNNIITDDQEERTMRRAMHFEGTCASNIVTGNNISGDPEGLSVPGEGNKVAQNLVR